jgi:sulfatase maturation enzyme AslB (radical SAM superfamily)
LKKSEKLHDNKSIPNRVDAHTHIPSERLVLNPPFPDAIKIEITSHCNYNCSYCATKRNLRPQGNMDKYFLYRILKEAKKIGVKEIGLFLLGESFLVKELEEYIRYAKEKAGIEYVFITTNGSLCDLDRMKNMIDAGLDSIKFSINGPNRECYKKWQNIDNFDLVVNNIKNLHAYLKNNKIRSLRTCVSSIYDEKHEKEYELFKTEISQYVDDFYYLPLYSQAAHTNSCNVVGNPGRLENMVDAIPCWALFNAAKITWNGYLTACCFDHDRRFEIADLNETTLMDAWHHPKFKKLRGSHLFNEVKGSLCEKCLNVE